MHGSSPHLKFCEGPSPQSSYKSPPCCVVTKSISVARFLFPGLELILQSTNSGGAAWCPGNGATFLILLKHMNIGSLFILFIFSVISYTLIIFLVPLFFLHDYFNAKRVQELTEGATTAWASIWEGLRVTTYQILV